MRLARRLRPTVTRALLVPSTVGALLLVLSGCGGSSRQSPLGPSAARAVSSSISPVPLTMQRFEGASAQGAVYRIVGRVTFRDESTAGLRLRTLDLDVIDEHGQRSRHSSEIEVVIAPGSSVTIDLPSTVRLTTGGRPTSLVVGATGVDANGDWLAVQSSAVPLIVPQPSTGGGLPAADATFVGAGDIANCEHPGAALTARLLQSIPGEVFTLGDHVYPNGTTESFSTCYESTWGAHRWRTRPTPGNHDWDVDGGRPYLAYFGPSAGRGYYSFDLGAWHVLSLNSNIGAQPGSAQYEWVRADLVAHPAACTLAYWHHPLFSSGPNGNNPQMQAMWRLLDEAGVELVMVGHDHVYERFAPQDADGRPTPAGIREFVVGTGGAPLYGVSSVRPNSEVRGNHAWGVLKLNLRAGSYHWEFVPAGGESFRDFGSASCGS
jgi:hypothetical protein